MNLHEKINEQTILYYVDANNWHHDDDGNEIIDVYELSFGFYDCHYMVYVTSKQLAEDSSFIQMEGDSRLFDSFEEACENEHWELIKAKCKQFDKYHAELNAA